MLLKQLEDHHILRREKCLAYEKFEMNGCSGSLKLTSIYVCYTKARKALKENYFFFYSFVLFMPRFSIHFLCTYNCLLMHMYSALKRWKKEKRQMNTSFNSYFFARYWCISFSVILYWFFCIPKMTWW